MTELDDFASSLLQDIYATAEATDSTLPDAFTQRVIEHLIDAGELDEALVCYHRSRGVEVSGYGHSDDGATVDLLVSNFQSDGKHSTMSSSDVQTAFKRLTTFLEACRAGYAVTVDDASPAYDMAQDVQICLKAATKVRLFVLTNSVVRRPPVPPYEVDGLTVEHHVWDAARLHRLLTSGTLHEPIIVDFERQFGEALSCLSTPRTDDDYSVFLAIFPGQMLAHLYDTHGPRLLELNVRSFLQTKGAVNRGIRDTLHQTPERFLAYNNGISATASQVDMTKDGRGILRLHDLQIVNGGQTTASIHNAVKKDGAVVDDVFVQAKITVVSPDKVSTIVPAISRYSNTQNKVTTADFSANDPFHVEVEKLSRSVWAPSAVGDGQDTRWFYERARGQYADEVVRQRTPARQKAFKLAHPTRQKFTKTDLAKFEATWDQLPHVVSRGAEKNFREFMLRLSSKGRPRVDQIYFQRLIAKAISFREAERIVSARQFGGYRANIVTYTLAKLVKSCESRIDLDAVWKRQGLSAPLRLAIDDLSVMVQTSLTNPPNGANVGEWCKKPEAWARVDSIRWSVPNDLGAELIDLRARRAAESALRAEAGEPLSPEVPLASSVSPQTWFECAKWAKETDRLAPWQRGLSFSLGQRATRGEPPTEKQAVQGLKLLQEAIDLGFRPEGELPSLGSDFT